MIKNLGIKEINYNLERGGFPRVNSQHELQRSLGPSYIRRRKSMDGKHDSLKKINIALGDQV